MSAFSLDTNFLEEELPAYQEIVQSADVVVEEREIDPSDDEDDYEEDQNSTTKQIGASKYATLKSIFAANDLQKHNARFYIEEAVITLPNRSSLPDSKPLPKPSTDQKTTLQSRRNRMALRLTTS